MKLRFKQTGNSAVAVLVLLAMFLTIVGGGIYGYVENVVKLCHSPEIAHWAALEVFRVIGVIVPVIGAVLGYF